MKNRKDFEKIIPLSCILLSLLLLSPLGIIVLPISVIVLIHAISYLALGLCFEIPELSLNALCLFLASQDKEFNRRRVWIDKILQVRYVLTYFIGPFTGILAITSGIYLAYRKDFSFQQGWLFWILIAAIIGLYKGMYQHNRYVKYLIQVSKEDGGTKLRQGILSPFDQGLIFLEFPTYVFIYWLACVKPNWFLAPSGDWGLGSTWLTGILMLAIGSFLVVPLRQAMHCYSAIYK